MNGVITKLAHFSCVRLDMSKATACQHHGAAKNKQEDPKLENSDCYTFGMWMQDH